MERERIVQVFFFAFLALMAYELYQIIYPFLAPLAWAILLAFLAHPALAHLDRLIRRRTVSALILTAAVALLVILPAVWLSGRLVTEAQRLYADAPKITVNRGVAKVGQWIAGTRPGAALDTTLRRHGISLEDEVRDVASQGAKVLSAYMVAHGEAVASNLASLFFHFGIMLLVLFYMLRDGESYYEGVRALTPLHEEDKAAVFDTLRITLSSVMRGLLLTALLDGISIGIAYLLCGVPYWAFLGILTAACGLLPIGGTAIVWVPVAIYLALEVGPGATALLVAWAIVTLVIVDNFIKPLAMQHGTGLPTLALFFGLAGGIEAFGPLGIFAGPAVIAVFAALLLVYRRTYFGETLEPPHALVENRQQRRGKRKGRQ